MVIPVLTQNKKPFMLDTKDILYYERNEKRIIIFHTTDEMYYWPRNIAELQKFLGPEGFEKCNKNQAVQLKKIKAIDLQLTTAYFDPIIKLGKKSCILSRSCMRKAVKLILKK